MSTPQQPDPNDPISAHTLLVSQEAAGGRISWALALLAVSSIFPPGIAVVGVVNWFKARQLAESGVPSRFLNIVSVLAFSMTAFWLKSFLNQEGEYLFVSLFCWAFFTGISAVIYGLKSKKTNEAVGGIVLGSLTILGWVVVMPFLLIRIAG